MTLQRLSDEANELLPIFNKTSSRFYNKSTVSAGDWSNQVKPKKKKEPIVIQNSKTKEAIKAIRNMCSFFANF